MLTVSNRRKTLVLLLLVMAFATPSAPVSGAQPERPRTLQAAPAGLEVFSRIWAFLQSVSIKEGCDINPDGRCRSQNRPPQTMAGCHVDPDGRCLAKNPPPQTKAGCDINPDGRCHS
jgi:hypothetical protein